MRQEVRADSDGHLSERLLLAETMDVATAQNQFARHETFHISATVDETVNMTTKEGESGGGEGGGATTCPGILRKPLRQQRRR